MMPIHTNDDLYMNAANTPAVFGKVEKKVIKQVKLKPVKDDNYIKNHIQVIAPIRYTNQVPLEAKLVCYAIMLFIIGCALWDGYRLISACYRGITKWIYNDASCIL
jgi:hypothetical protein